MLTVAPAPSNRPKMETTWVACHQPNFLPWLGFFSKFDLCDIFLVLDDVQIQRTRGHFTNRCAILQNGKRRWLSIPVQRADRSIQRISEVQTAGASWKASLLETIRHAYRRAPFFDDVFGLITQIMQIDGESLAEFNIQALKKLCLYLNLDPSKIRLASEYSVESTASVRLAELTKIAGGTGYITGQGANDYLDPSVFNAQGLTLAYQIFTETDRPQFAQQNFEPGLSTIDALFTIGRDETIKHIQSGYIQDHSRMHL